MAHVLCTLKVRNSTEWNDLGCERFVVNSTTGDMFNNTHSSSSAAPAVVESGPRASLAGGGWRRVRHTPNQSTWCPFTDSLSGTEVRGSSSDDTACWSEEYAT